MIYLDNAATSYPKPIEVINAVNKSFSHYSANPGRSGHSLSVNTTMQVFSCREKLNDLFDGFGEEFVSFTMNCTYALNFAIKSVLKKGDHCLISSLEHNSVLRPVNKLKEDGIIDYSIFAVNEDEDETLESLKSNLRNNTKLIVVTAVSNVFGNIMPLEKIGEFAKEKNILFFVDGAQGAGIIPLKMNKMKIDCLAVPGHKGLMGPMGTGVLLHNGCIENSLIEGGTGTESFNFAQPKIYPELLESGTLNVPAICGLKKGVEIVLKCGEENIFKEETELMKYMFNELMNLRGIVVYRENYDEEHFAPIVSFNVNGMHSEETASLFNEQGIAVRGGFQCSPLAHKTYGTEATGVVRVSPSKFTTKKDVNYVLNFLQKIAKNKNL